MQSFLTYSDMKNKPIRAKIKLSKSARLILFAILVLAVGVGANTLLNKLNDMKKRDLSETVITQLLNNGTYASIQPYTDERFLGELAAEDYNASASGLMSLKGSVVSALNSSDNTVFGTIAPVDATKDGQYLFGYVVTFEKTGVNSYKVTDIVTDYGRESFFEAN